MSLINIKSVLVPFDMEIHLKIWMPNYQKLKTMVKRSMDQKLRLRNFDARNERIENWQWKAKKQCSRGYK